MKKTFGVKPMPKYTFIVYGTAAERYEVEADSYDEAEDLAAYRFREEVGIPVEEIDLLESDEEE